MKCPYCNGEMKEGLLFSSKDGALSFATELPSMMKNASNAEGFIQLTKLKAGGRANMKAMVCENCKKGIFEWG